MRVRSCCTSAGKQAGANSGAGSEETPARPLNSHSGQGRWWQTRGILIDPCGSQIAKVQPPPSPAPLAHLFFSQNEHPGAQPHARCRWSRCSWGRVTSCPCETPRARPRPPPGPSPNPLPVPAPRRPHAGLPAPHAPAATAPRSGRTHGRVPSPSLRTSGLPPGRPVLARPSGRLPRCRSRGSLTPSCPSQW